MVVYPRSSKCARHGSQLRGSSHSPWTKTTGFLPEELAREMSACSCSVSAVIDGLLKGRHHLLGRWACQGTEPRTGCENAAVNHAAKAQAPEAPPAIANASASEV